MAWIAVSAKGMTPDALVDARFGRAEGFVLFDPETQHWSYLSKGEALAQASGAGIATVERLAKANVRIVYSGSIGPKAARALSAAGIASVERADGRTVREALAVANALATPNEQVQ
jgi:predicted Fe-Mo cluster-binding NifX family protein